MNASHHFDAIVLNLLFIQGISREYSEARLWLKVAQEADNAGGRRGLGVGPKSVTKMLQRFK